MIGKLLGKATMLADPVLLITVMVKNVWTELLPWTVLLSVTWIPSVHTVLLVTGAFQVVLELRMVPEAVLAVPSVPLAAVKVPLSVPGVQLDDHWYVSG
ncbi:MAG TPA: hypothetical protein VIM19_13905 [Actinomycetes bacterium]